MKRILSWNVNGIRAVQKKGFIEWLKDESPDILAIQETKAQIEQLDDELVHIEEYKSYFMSAVKKGYSGTALYLKGEPESVENLGCEEFDNEGRTIIAHFKNFSLINCYFPNSQEAGKRLDYKLRFCDEILAKCNELVAAGKNVVLCGDYNIAHTEIDLKTPKTNHKNPGFLPEERAWMTKYLDAGYADVFRRLHPDEVDHYTWWSYRFKARDRDVGWRIDYHCVNNEFAKKVIRADIRNEVMGSDHCPVLIEIDVD